jgi:hypothetical protein
MRSAAYALLVAASVSAACNRTAARGDVARDLTADGTRSSERSDAAPGTNAASPAAHQLAADSASHAGPPAPRFREITIPAGTAIPVVLDTMVRSDTSRVEESVRGHIARNVVVDGATVLPGGTAVSGVVTEARRSGKVKGRARVAMRFTSIDPPGEERYRVQTRTLAATAPASKQDDAVKIAAPAIGGAVVGGLLGGGKGAAIGTAAGGGAGTAVVLNTRGKEVRFAKGSTVAVRLSAPVTVRVNP